MKKVPQITRLLQARQLEVRHLDETTASAEEAARTLRVELEKLAQSTGHNMKLVPRQEVEALTDFPPGGVSPVGHDLPVILDQGLFDFSVVWAAAGSPFHVFEVAPEVLKEITHAEVCDFT